MNEEQDHSRDIAEIRSMMERSSKFLSLSGMAGIMAGVYALAGAFIVYKVFSFNPDRIFYPELAGEFWSSDLLKVALVALVVLLLALSTAIFLSAKNARKKGLRVWNATTRRLLVQAAVPLSTGGVFVLILISHGMIGLVAPATLLFYGLALYCAGHVTYPELKILGLIQLLLGLIGAAFVAYGLLCWAVGFGLFHIFYGIYLHYKYEK